jgi:putative transposase
MQTISYARHRFPPDVIRHAVWLYLRFTLSYRDVEDLLAERGLEISNETIRRWLLKFGPVVARNLRRGRPVPHDPARGKDQPDRDRLAIRFERFKVVA